MKQIIKKRCHEFLAETKKKMGTPVLYVVDFIPKPLTNWESKTNIDNYNHTKNIWFNLYKMINRYLLGRHPGRGGNRSLLLHSFNFLEAYDKKRKKEWNKVPPHLHSILLVHPLIKNKFKELLEFNLEELFKDKNNHLGVGTSPYTIRSEVFSGEFGNDLKCSIRSLVIKIPYDLDGIVDYYCGLWENWKAIHPENVFKNDIEEKLDGMGVFILPSEHDFKKKRRVYPLREVEEEIVSLGLVTGVS